MSGHQAASNAPFKPRLASIAIYPSLIPSSKYSLTANAASMALFFGGESKLVMVQEVVAVNVMHNSVYKYFF